MFDLALPHASPDAAYPEQATPHLGALDKLAERIAAPFARALKTRNALSQALVQRVNDLGPTLARASDADLRRGADELRVQLRREGFRPEFVARSFALVREVSHRTIGQRHFDVQLHGGAVLLGGMIAEMETGEGKTLTATLAASTAALAGVPVHIITVNDYLTQRDADFMRPVYAALGLTTGSVVNGQQPPERRAMYGRDITYCTNKELTFDYLRDRIALGRQSTRIRLSIEKLAGAQGRVGQLVLRGLFFAIVDEADSVLVDEARTPLIISSRSDQAPEREMYEVALQTAARMRPTEHFVIDDKDRTVHLEEAGKGALSDWAVEMPPAFKGKRRREELVTQALTALHVFHRDKQYLVAPDDKGQDKVQIIDEYTGRILPDRSWEQGLHQMVEAKEGVQLTGQQSSIARMTYQRFFKRYLWLAGMTGTASEVAGELWSTYGLAVVKVPTNRPVVREDLGERIYPSQPEKWEAILERVKAVHAQGRPVLVGTRSVSASEHLSGLLQRAGLAHRLLNARQDKEEANIVAEAGQPGRITVATNMAGRGTDIRLSREVLSAGGLHVIATEFHESRRIDRQLFGRCGRQGDPGSFEAIAALDDELLKTYLGPVARTAAGSAGSAIPPALVRQFRRMAQARAERANAAIRRALLSSDEKMGDMLAFSGRGE
jgi:preprotein translocase subunit SecA